MKNIAGLRLVLLWFLAFAFLSPVHSALARGDDQGKDILVPFPMSKPLALEGRHVAVVAKSVPVPHHRPDFSIPVTEHLLSYGNVPVPLKRPLSARGGPLSRDNALLYKKIFTWQARANWGKANELLNMLGDYRLRGHVLSQRYMHPSAYRASFEELLGWMDLYADHPEAVRIYKLALARMPGDFKGAIRKPAKQGRGVSGYVGLIHDKAKRYKSPKRRSQAQLDDVIALSRTIRRDLSRGGPTQAYKRLLEDSRAKYLDRVEYDSLRARIANSYMLVGKLDKALDLAQESARRSGAKVPQAGWVAGLVSWRQGDYRQATASFALTAQNEYASSWMQAAGAYWASRAAMQAGHVRHVTPWLEKAASHPRTFYGLLATRALGWDFDFNFDMPPIEGAQQKALVRVPGTQRAMALVAAGQFHRAESELRNLNIGKDRAMKQALLVYAEKAGMPAFSMRLAEAIAAPDGQLYDAALYPLVPWSPGGGYKIDRALIHALIRQESRFDPEAQNKGSGATGLMQLMPQTASYVAGKADFRSASGRHALKDPRVNLDIGQRYIQELLAQSSVGNELFSLLIAYNAGPGNLRKWKRELGHVQNDPLLFIESIPVAETREFVERVMANNWIYRLRLNQQTPSLDDVAQGGWARYVSLDSRMYAENETEKSKVKSRRSGPQKTYN